MKNGSLTGEAIICFGADWGRHPSSTQKLMEKLARRNRLLWINSLGGRSIKLSKTDLLRVLAKLKERLAAVRKVSDNVFVHTPLVVPFHGFELIRLFNLLVLLFSIRFLMKKLGTKYPILFVSHPYADYLVGRLREKISVYYCSDEFSEFPGVSAELVRKLERRLLEKVDLVVVTSERLRTSKRSHHRDVFLIRHGVEFDHFHAVLTESHSAPEDIHRIPQPVIGFYGLIDERIDFKLIEYLAGRHPDWSIVLIGEIVTEPDFAGRIPNVHFLGPKPYEQLPHYSQVFRVAIIPYKITRLTLNISPLKLLEYLAAGKPVVSTDLPECKRYGSIVEIATNREEFERAVKESLLSGRSGLVRKRTNIARRETWNVKAAQLMDILSTTIRNRTDSAPQRHSHSCEHGLPKA